LRFSAFPFPEEQHAAVAGRAAVSHGAVAELRVGRAVAALRAAQEVAARRAAQEAEARRAAQAAQRYAGPEAQCGPPAQNCALPEALWALLPSARALPALWVQLLL